MKKLISSLLIPLMLLQLEGCYSMMPISKDDLLKENYNEEILLLTFNDSLYHFEYDHYKISGDSVSGVGESSANSGIRSYSPFEGSVALKDVKNIEAQRFDISKTLYTLILTGGIAGLIVLLGKGIRPVGNFRM